MRRIVACMVVVLSGCVSPRPDPTECVTAKRVQPAPPLDEPALVTCHRLGQFLVCNPISERA